MEEGKSAYCFVAEKLHRDIPVYFCVLGLDGYFAMTRSQILPVALLRRCKLRLLTSLMSINLLSSSSPAEPEAGWVALKDAILCEAKFSRTSRLRLQRSERNLSTKKAECLRRALERLQCPRGIGKFCQTATISL